jgi:hypothetical protein
MPANLDNQALSSGDAVSQNGQPLEVFGKWTLTAAPGYPGAATTWASRFTARVRPAKCRTHGYLGKVAFPRRNRRGPIEDSDANRENWIEACFPRRNRRGPIEESP